MQVPADALCGTHPARPAVAVCVRCGGFTCADCRTRDAARCPARDAAVKKPALPWIYFGAAGAMTVAAAVLCVVGLGMVRRILPGYPETMTIGPYRFFHQLGVTGLGVVRPAQRRAIAFLHLLFLGLALVCLALAIVQARGVLRHYGL